MAGFFKNLFNRFSSQPEIDWDDLEASLITGDLGPRLAVEITDTLKNRGGKLKADDVVKEARSRVRANLPGASAPLAPQANGMPTVILMVGVNGTGKTTSTAKLAQHLTQQGHTVQLAAADTFRAAAVEQLEAWSQRLDIPLLKGAPNADPAAVCFDAWQKAVREKRDFLICDTAGRLHTKHNLMEELKKIRRVVGRQDETAPHEVLLVVDATTGSNALQQAREFHKAVPLTGLIVTKLDGSGKGGILVPIYRELEVPTRFVGLGETADAFRPFDPDQFVNELL